jgi:hypothetical protein
MKQIYIISALAFVLSTYSCKKTETSDLVTMQISIGSTSDIYFEYFNGKEMNNVIWKQDYYKTTSTSFQQLETTYLNLNIKSKSPITLYVYQDGNLIIHKSQIPDSIVIYQQIY